MEQHVKTVARLALQHRRPDVQQGNQVAWSQDDDQRIEKMLSGD